jgi:hypothetical protein
VYERGAGGVELAAAGKALAGVMVGVGVGELLIISLISDTCNSEGDKSPGIQCRNKLNVQHKWNDYRKAYQRYMQY